MLKIKKKEHDFSKKSCSLSYFSLKVCALADFQVIMESNFDLDSFCSWFDKTFKASIFLTAVLQ